MNRVYEKTVSRLLEAMSNGIIPWKRPWISPINALSQKPYRGINFLMLATADHADPRYVTFLQAHDMGGTVRRGAQGYPIIKWHFPTEQELQRNSAARPWAKCYTVFNVEQCEGLTKLPQLLSSDHDPIAEAQSIIDNWIDKPKISHGGFVAAYNPIADTVAMPETGKFCSAEAYYDTLFHELVHSTGHHTRMNRELAPSILREKYGFEELIAEIGGAMLDSEAHIDGSTLIQNNAAYLQSWLAAVRDDPGMIVKAATKAAVAVDMILGRAMREDSPTGPESQALAIAA